MKINISELFKYRQYIDAPVCYCLDRKDYKVCDISVYQTEPDTPLFLPAPGEPNISWIDGKNEYATVAMTKCYDGTEEPTLPINLGTHSIYFYAE